MLSFPRSRVGRLALASAALFLVACGGPAPLTDGDDGAAPQGVDLADGGDAAIGVDAGDAGIVISPDAGERTDAEGRPDAEDAAIATDAGDALDGAARPDAEPSDAADAGDGSAIEPIDAADGSTEDAADSDTTDGAVINAPDSNTVDSAAAPDAADADTADTSVVDNADAADVSVPDAADAALPDQDGDGVPDALDCAPLDPNAWQWLAYAYRDADGDGHTVPAAPGAQVCSGKSLPVGYSNVATDLDCDDTRASVWAWLDGYVDQDGDGVGSTESAHLCTNGQLPPGYSTTSTDCAPTDRTRWEMLAYTYRDADGDGYTVPANGTVCSGWSLPAGYTNLATGDDCNDNDASVWNPQTLYVDEDHDGVGDGPPQSLCVAVSPVGYSPRGGDCAPMDSTRWQLLSYSYRDADGDTYTVANPGSICTGASLPPGYAMAFLGNDCNDTNPLFYQNVSLFTDQDKDGVGDGSATIQCIGSTDPPGYVEVGGDCAPTDPTRYYWAAYSYVDRDKDNATVPEAGQYCGDGSLPPPYFTTASGLDCDDTNPAVDHYGAGYVDADHDGFGAGRSLALCLGTAIPVGYSQFGTDENDADPTVTENLDDDLDPYF